MCLRVRDLCEKTKKEKKKKKKTKEKKPENLVSHISETSGMIYFNFGIQPPLIGRHFHSKFGDLRVKGHESMNA